MNLLEQNKSISYQLNETVSYMPSVFIFMLFLSFGVLINQMLVSFILGIIIALSIYIHQKVAMRGIINHLIDYMKKPSKMTALNFDNKKDNKKETKKIIEKRFKYSFQKLEEKLKKHCKDETFDYFHKYLIKINDSVIKLINIENEENIYLLLKINNKIKSILKEEKLNYEKIEKELNQLFNLLKEKQEERSEKKSD